jgi:hypothetical protein
MNQLFMGLLGGLVGSLFFIYPATFNWKLSVKIALVLAVLEGALRKWALPQASQLIYFLKDLVLIGAYLSFFFGSRVKRLPGIKNNSITLLVYCMVVYCFFQVLNPSLGSPLVGILGVKNYLFYIPFLWLVPSLFSSTEELYKFLRSYLLLLIPVGLLAIAQFFSPVDSPLNTYAPGGAELGIALSGDVRSVRVTGTFSYLSGYTVYLSVCIALLLPLLSRPQRFRWQQATVLEMLLASITLFMTGARGLLFNSILILISYLGLLGMTSLAQLNKVLRRFVVAALLGFLVVSFQFRAAVDALWLRITSNQDVSSRLGNTFLQPFQFWEYAGWDGYGAGATFQATEFLRAQFNLPPGEEIPVGYEEEPGRVMLEMGPLGFLLWYLLRIVLLIAMWQVYCRLKRPFLRQLALSIFLLHCSYLFGSVVFIHTANLYYWFFSGFAFLLPRLEKIERLRQKQNSWMMQHVQGSYLPDPSHH